MYLQIVAASYGPGPGPYGPSNGVEELINAATAGNPASASSLTATADVSAPPSAQPGLAQANAQLNALNQSPIYNAYKNSGAIAESLAEKTLAANIRQGRINVVAPNVVGQTALRSLLVPTGLNNHQVIATQPMQPMIVTQPGGPPQQVISGPPAVVRAAPVIYKLKPSIIYQQEVINKVPTPLSLNPVYVKVYKPGKQVDTPNTPVVAPIYGQAAPAYAPSAAGAAASSAASGGDVSYGPAPAYANAPASYGSPTYASGPASYGAVPPY